MNAGRCPQLRIIELGPGRGTLMADVLRVCVPLLQCRFSLTKRVLVKVASKFAPGGQIRDVHLVETSSAMRDLQKAKLQPQANQLGCKLHWHDAIDDIPPSKGFSMILAHEFFDALPFHLLQVRFHVVIILSTFTHSSHRKDKVVGKKS